LAEFSVTSVTVQACLSKVSGPCTVIASVEADIECDADPSSANFRKMLTACLLENLEEITEQLDEEEIDKLARFPFLQFKVKSGDDEYESKRVDNPIHWKNMYLQLKRECSKTQQPVQPAAKLDDLLKQLQGCKDKLSEVKLELIKHQNELTMCQERRKELEDKLKEIQSKADKLSDELSNCYLKLITTKQECSKAADKDSSKVKEELVDTLKQVAPNLSSNLMMLAKSYLEGQQRLEELRHLAKISETMNRSKSSDPSEKLLSTLSKLAAVLVPEIAAEGEGISIPLISEVGSGEQQQEHEQNGTVSVSKKSELDL